MLRTAARAAGGVSRGVARGHIRAATRVCAALPQRVTMEQATRNVSTTPIVGQQPAAEQEKQPFTELVRDFLEPKDFYDSVKRNGIEYFCGVPDSLLKDFCAYVTANTPATNHVITANEGNAVALAAGYHLATGKYGMVYLQNSGLGNIVNPLMSLAVPEVYSIPMLLLVGWRGEPGKKDEPQHLIQGQSTPGLLASLNIPFQVLPDFQEGAEKVIKQAVRYMESNLGPYAVLVRRQTFLPYKLPSDKGKFEMNREGALKVIVDGLGDRDIVVGTTGMLSRELFEYRVAKKHGHDRDFLTVGSMGHASAIALGIAGSKPQRQVFCLDGDGALIMHMGAMVTVGNSQPRNFKHVVINNGAHDSVGGQPTLALRDNLNFRDIAKACGYKWTAVAETVAEAREKVAELKQTEGPALLEIRVNKGGRKDLGRPTRSPIENKQDFMAFLEEDQ